MQTTSLEKARC